MSKPVMRTGPVVEEAGIELAKALDKWLTDTGPSVVYRNCDNCIHMTENSSPAMCTYHNASPPASVIVVGCDQHEDKEEIPF